MAELSWVAIPNADWITVNPSVGVGDATINISVQDADSFTAETASTVTVKYGSETKEIKVTRCYPECDCDSLEILESSQWTYRGGSQKIGIYNPKLITSLQVNSKSEWINIRDNQGELTANVAINNGEERNGTVEIKYTAGNISCSKTYEVRQAGYPEKCSCESVTVSINGGEMIPFDGGGYSIDYEGDDCVEIVSSSTSSDFVEVKYKTITVQPNETTETRSATISVVFAAKDNICDVKNIEIKQDAKKVEPPSNCPISIVENKSGSGLITFSLKYN